MTSNIIPEGFKDDVSIQVASEHKFKNMMIDYFQSNGFDLVKTPLVEFYNKEKDDNVFKILVKKNEKKLNFRDDITLQVARLSQTRLSKKISPLKLCYYGEVVRKSGSMLRPERQFLQIGAECIGEKSFLADVEMMELAYSSLSLVGIKNITIEISSRVFFDKFINMIKNFKNKNEIKRLIKLKDLKSLLKILNKKYHQYIQDLFSCTGIYKDKKNNLKYLQIDKKTTDEINNIQNIIKKFIFIFKDANIFLDFCEINDKNYHSGVRFTFFANNVRGEIASGGRYYIKNENKKNIATGFTCYMDTILRASSANLCQKKIIVPFDISKSKHKKLINKDYSILKYTGKSIISKKLAKDYNCQFYLLNNSIKPS